MKRITIIFVISQLTVESYLKTECNSNGKWLITLILARLFLIIF
ncbi:MAG: hypothetical protein WA584_22440 [Pyrinomonadaceae bacterium]